MHFDNSENQCHQCQLVDKKKGINHCTTVLCAQNFKVKFSHWAQSGSRWNSMLPSAPK